MIFGSKMSEKSYEKVNFAFENSSFFSFFMPFGSMLLIISI